MASNVAKVFQFCDVLQNYTASSLVDEVRLLFGRSCVIVGHHRLTDELFPAAAVFGSPYAL